MNKKHLHIRVKIKDYERYFEKYGHARLDRWNRIIPDVNTLPKFIRKFNEEEIFDGIETPYELIENNNGYLILFKSNSNTEYRFDLLKEPDTDIYHLGFSTSDKKVTDNDDVYSSLTYKGESKEVFAKLVWILKDLVPKLNIHQFCIGATNDEQKNKIYQYMMRLVSGWERKESNQYDLGWALYFTLN
mgnify:CR=1 FL=1